MNRPARLIWAAALAAPALAAVPDIAGAQTNLDVIGLTKLLELNPSLTGAGVRVGQAEANFGSSPYLYEVNPAVADQPASLFSYTDQFGNVSNTFTPSAESWHADTVGADFYGGSGLGVAPGVSHVDIYSADDFYDSVIFWDKPIPDAIVSESFGFGQSANMATNIANQEASDTYYDNYIAEYGTIIVSAAGNGGSTTYPIAPSTAYNGISVADDDGPSAVGPTIDDGRSKPDITAPGGATSFSTPLVSGSAAILVQAAQQGDGGSSPQVEAAGADARTIKALLLNGADKQAVTFNRTHTQPLDPANGAGLLNVYNSYDQLVAGDHPASSMSSSLILGDAHAPDVTSAAINSLAGWNLATFSSSLLTDEYANYVFQPPAGVSGYTFTSTLVWERPFNSNESVPGGINNLDLYLYDTTTKTLVDYSVSTVDNVQTVYDLDLKAGDRYDLEVFKGGGIVGVTPGLVSYSETYALAFNFAALQSVWSLPGGGMAVSSSNWNGGVPAGAGQTASFDGSITAPSTVMISANWTVGNVNFDNSNSYNIVSTAGAALILDNGGAAATAAINDTGGSHTIGAAVQLNSSLSVSVVSAADTVSIAGNISDNPAAGGASVTMNGSGTLMLGGVNTYRGGTVVNSGALVVASSGGLPCGGNVVNNSVLSIQAGSAASPVMAGLLTGGGQLAVGGAGSGYFRLAAKGGTSSQSSVTVAAGSTLDITNNTLTINYGSRAADPVAAVASALNSGYDGGTWTGTGITSSTAAAATGHLPLYSVGYDDGNTDAGTSAAANQIVVKYTLAGDANLDGVVNFWDLVTVLQNLNTTGKDWAHGNFTYSPIGAVTFVDLVMVIQDFDRTIPASSQAAPEQTQTTSTFVALPEPAAVFSVPAGLVLMRRRRKNSPPKDGR